MVGRFLEWASQRKLALITFAFVGIGVVGALLIGLA